MTDDLEEYEVPDDPTPPSDDTVKEAVEDSGQPDEPASSQSETDPEFEAGDAATDVGGTDAPAEI
jgi:hypothetical protein